ncbi:MAG: hypothetical protein JXA06_09175 [Bacteroidetes bacterium]|nr:hypothetical protein [Bacteroidota bacterium]
MKNSNIDMLAKDILKNSYLEVTDPDFNITTMKKILHESRKQYVLENILLSFLIFVAVDALIFLILWLSGLNIFELAARFIGIPHEILFHVKELKSSIIENAFIKYVMLSFGVVMVILMIIESKLKLFGRLK